MVSFAFIFKLFRKDLLALYVGCSMAGVTFSACADEVIFNTDILDINDRKNIDLTQFSRGGYIMPGEYIMTIHVNELELSEQTVVFHTVNNQAGVTEACLSPEIVQQLGLNPDAQKKIIWASAEQCLVIGALPGMVVRGDLAASALYISVPQAYLEYAVEGWDPSSRWDNGIPGLLMDYTVNTQTQRQQQGTHSNQISSNGTAGANAGPWRLRADWQSQLNGNNGSTSKSWDWNRYYAYRAVPTLGAKLLLGQTFLDSNIFDSFRFTGASLMTDDAMLPPNLRGYAPEVVGVARTNAKVTISQEGRILYESYVAPGPFRIQDINSAVSGQMHVRVEEADGHVQEFNMDTASIPYLTRPGSVRYKIAAGAPSNWQQKSSGTQFVAGEFSWGVSNGWSLYGGSVAGGDYNSLAIGFGRDLMALGAISFDATHSRAALPNEKSPLSGQSYRLSYSKRFDDYNSQVTFAGYRFSERDFMTMNEYVDAKSTGTRSHSSKEMYTLTFNKQFVDMGISAYLNYTHQTYWDRPENNNYNLTLSRYFDVGRLKNVSMSLTGYRNKYNGIQDDGLNLSLSIPWGQNGSVSYNSMVTRNDINHQLSYADRVNEQDTYQLGTGISRSGSNTSGYYSHQGSQAQVNGYASYSDGAYSAAGVSLQGGVTATLEGAALHRSSGMGGTRVMIDTDGAANVPVRGYGVTSKTNHFGKAVVTDVSNYYRNKISIDLNALPDNVEATRSVVQATLTEGAIGYRRFDVVSGEKAMAVIRLADGSMPPFGASVLNNKIKEVGIVGESGSVYLSGIKAGEQMEVHWEGRAQCVLRMPATLPPQIQTDLLLPCHQVESDQSPVMAMQ